MDAIRKIAVFGALLIGIFGASSLVVTPVQAKCCSRVGGGCDGASQSGCAMGNSQNMFFDDPCVCDAGDCVDPTNGNAACGGTVPANCGNGMLETGEQCDAGSANGTFASCCAINCTFKTNGTLCDDGTFCDGEGACNGSSNTCVVNAGGQVCPDPTKCIEETRSCQVSEAPAVSTGILLGLAAMMTGAAVLVLRRRHNHQN